MKKCSCGSRNFHIIVEDGKVRLNCIACGSIRDAADAVNLEDAEPKAPEKVDDDHPTEGVDDEEDEEDEAGDDESDA